MKQIINKEDIIIRGKYIPTTIIGMAIIFLCYVTLTRNIVIDYLDDKMDVIGMITNTHSYAFPLLMTIFIVGIIFSAIGIFQIIDWIRKAIVKEKVYNYTIKLNEKENNRLKKKLGFMGEEEYQKIISAKHKKICKELDKIYDYKINYEVIKDKIKRSVLK
jgi:hypothetical protein